MSILNEPWRKSWKEVFQSRKMRRVHQRDGHGTFLAVWQACWMTAESRYASTLEAAQAWKAGTLDPRGYLRVGKDPMTAEDLADLLALPVGVVSQAIVDLLDAAWLGRLGDGTLYVCNLVSRQLSTDAFRKALGRSGDNSRTVRGLSAENPAPVTGPTEGDAEGDAEGESRLRASSPHTPRVRGACPICSGEGVVRPKNGEEQQDTVVYCACRAGRKWAKDHPQVFRKRQYEASVRTE